MVNKIFSILLKIFAIIFLLFVCYILLIFVMPEFADNFGDKNFNIKIREAKEKSLQFSDPDGSLNISF